MNDLVENTLELEIIADMLLVGDTLSQWKKRKPTDQINDMAQAFTRIVMYVNKLQMEKKAFDIAISNVKQNKNEEIMRWKERAELAEKALTSNPLNL